MLFKKHREPQLNTRAPRYPDWVSLLSASPENILLEAPTLFRRNFKPNIYSSGAPIFAHTQKLQPNNKVVAAYTFTKKELAGIHPQAPLLWEYYSVNERLITLGVLHQFHQHWAAPDHFVGSFLEIKEKISFKKEVYIKEITVITSLDENAGTVDIRGVGYVVYPPTKNMFKPSIPKIRTPIRFTDIPIDNLNRVYPYFSQRIAAAQALGLIGEALGAFVLSDAENTHEKSAQLPQLQF